MGLNRYMRCALSYGIALWAASCASGLPPDPTKPTDNSAAERAGASAAAGSGSVRKSGIGEKCPTGVSDCIEGLRCVETVVDDLPIKLCMAPCKSDDDDEIDCDSDESD